MSKEKEFIVNVNYRKVWRSAHHAYELHPNVIKWLNDNIGPFEDLEDWKSVQKPNTWRYYMPDHSNHNESHFNSHWDDAEFVFGDKESAVKFKLKFV